MRKKTKTVGILVLVVIYFFRIRKKMQKEMDFITFQDDVVIQIKIFQFTS